MQTLRKRTSPCKYKNDPSRFLGEGITFKAKLIGILEVSEARGDKMCQDALNDLKTAIRAAGEHKQRITISISIDGLRLRDEKTGDCLYHHPVHKISFIAQDMSDSRAFGYIFGSPDTGHRFFGIKTDKTASQVVISMRDLFQVVFELKKKEIEMAKHHSETHHFKYGSAGYMDAIHFAKDESEQDKGKGKYPHVIKSRCLSSKPGDSGSQDHKAPPSEAIADLLDLEHELNTIQQGIHQMDKITPSDPFGPLSSKTEPYANPFDGSFPAKPAEDKAPVEKDASDHFYRPSFLSQFSPGAAKPRTEDGKWFAQDSGPLLGETGSVGGADATSPPAPLIAPALEPEQTEGKRSPIKTDLFTELDPLGTGRVKPYVDKKDFFQELKNPPKKLLKEMITDFSSSTSASGRATASDLPPFQFAPHFKGKKNPPPKKDSSTLDSVQGFQERKSSKIDPFDEEDPFEESDPFQEVIFPEYGHRSSTDDVFDDKLHWTFDKSAAREGKPGSGGGGGAALRVNIPPEKAEVPMSISTITSKLKWASPPSPDDPKATRRKCYQSLRQSTLEAGEESPGRDELFVSVEIGANSEWAKIPKIVDIPSPDPPPKTTFFSLRPPPLPPKKQKLTPPARPPSFEDKFGLYDYVDKKEGSDGVQDVKCVKLKKQGLNDRAPSSESKKQNPGPEFPVLPPPPHRKISGDGTKGPPKKAKPEETPPASVLNLKLNQLDNTGLENLAISLGIPSENIYSMTLQELTKMLAEKYLMETKSEQPTSFEADFDANFGKAGSKSPVPSYDKYAVFKELMKDENKEPEAQQDEKERKGEKDGTGQEEDKYAALRQLSLGARTENFSEADDDDGGTKAEGSSPKASEDSPGGSAAPEPTWQSLDRGPETNEEKSTAASKAKSSGVQEQNPTYSSETQMFPLADQFSEEKKPSSPRDNWATFEKADFEGAGKKSGDIFNENENSPFSSDGKEEMREIRFEWHGNAFGKRKRKDVPWRDDDESWDDYSPKESCCSDESSHEERSPEGGGDDTYEKTWTACGRPPKTWNRQQKWQEETEDEFEDSWRKQREKSGSYETERKNFWHNNYEKYNKRYDWYGNTRNEPWEENSRHHCYGNRRKRSESDNEYRKRCDSDASDKEFVWTFQKDYADVHGRTGKQKQYTGPGHCPEHCREPRSKHRKAAPQKRPTSASEPKRSYDKFSPGSFRASEKSYPVTKREPENSRFVWKEPRHRGESEFAHYCSSYDRKSSRSGSRGSRGSGPDVFPKRGDAAEAKNHKFGYFDPFSEKNSKYGKGPGSQFQFAGEVGKAKKGVGEETSREFPEKRAANQWASANGKSETFYSAKNNNEDFGSFRDGFKSPPKTSKGDGKPEICEGGKKNKNHLGMLGRQEAGGNAIRKSDSVNIFSRDKDPFEGDDFFSSVS